MILDRRYETFLTLAKTASYTKTAQQLFITQPAVTQQIASLQKDLQIELVKYERPKLIITPAGQELAKFIESVTIKSHQILAHLKQPNDKRPLKFGATLSFNAIVEPQFIKQISDQFTDINCLVANTDQILSQIDNGEIEFGLVEGNFQLADYDFIPIFKDDFIAVCNSKNPLAKKKAVQLTDCLQWPLLLRERGSGTRSILENWLGTMNRSVTDFSKVITVGDMTTIIGLLESNLGISFMYRSLLPQQLANGQLIQLPLADFKITRTLSMVFQRQSYYEAQYRQMANIIKRLLGQ
ncbi:LysR family transcriptional regulator [Lentilactobacillus raoultii]|uniref:LysR family transcriptional regulator n=1 Tax=Lentilactobacillus raoultii TaxID=1987503 RepID=A0ABW3PLE7_9LACO|nr:LysR family transcriptional regulator [Lentilactobacillus raoultii]